ncbi:hypothetical protein F5Y04DRAFT_249565 [Hypomontagnella monticulosa]|nr:hypothetical protein F5Y04DRAFT_249565 [Hypomontagnella monticulosa]
MLRSFYDFRQLISNPYNTVNSLSLGTGHRAKNTGNDNKIHQDGSSHYAKNEGHHNVTSQQGVSHYSIVRGNQNGTLQIDTRNENSVDGNENRVGQNGKDNYCEINGSRKECTQVSDGHRLVVSEASDSYHEHVDRQYDTTTYRRWIQELQGFWAEAW